MGTTNRNHPLPPSLLKRMRRDPWNLLRRVSDGSATKVLEDWLRSWSKEDPASSYDEERGEHVDLAPLLVGGKEEATSRQALLHSFLLELGEVLVEDFRARVDRPGDVKHKADYLDEKLDLVSRTKAHEEWAGAGVRGFVSTLRNRLREIAGHRVASEARPPIPSPQDSKGWPALAERVYSQPEKGYDYSTVAWVLRRWAWLREDHPSVGVTKLYGLLEVGVEDDYPTAEQTISVQPGLERDSLESSQCGFPERKTVKGWVLKAGLRWNRVGS